MAGWKYRHNGRPLKSVTAVCFLVTFGPFLFGVLPAPASAGGEASVLHPARSIPNPGGGNELLGVACETQHRCWAVGDSEFYSNTVGVAFNQGLSWNGRSWELALMPDTGAPIDLNDYAYQLNGIGCSSSTFCWAVGRAPSPVPPSQGLGTFNETLLWSKSKWSSVPTPQPGDFSQGGPSLAGVACPSPKECWAVGSYTNKAGAILNEALLWNGTSWKFVPTPNSNGQGAGAINELAAIACSGPRSCWAVGDRSNGTELLHWDGGQWTLVKLPQQSNTLRQLSGIACPSSRTCLAVGGGDLNGLLVWKGKKWSLVKSSALPDPGGRGDFAGNWLNSIACTSTTNCWAVGAYLFEPVEGSTTNQALHWDGVTWQATVVPTPELASSLASIACPSSSDCWTVGSSTGADHPRNEILHWDGNTWSLG
jgi:hypothetical protein